MATSFSRRDAIRAALAVPVGMGMGMANPPTREVRAFRLIEPAGLRRFGFPVHATVPDAREGRNFRLIRDGRAVPAQFRPVVGPDGRLDVALDFSASLGPLESARYEVLFGTGVEPGPEPSGGLKVERRDGAVRVAQGSALTFEIAEDLVGFLRSVGSPRLGYVRPGNGGLILRGRGETAGSPLGPVAPPIVTREGPMAVGLRFVQPDARGSAITVDLTIPHTKSWVEVVVTADDPGARCAGLGMTLDLLIEGSPTLVDLGAGSTVYGQIQGGKRMELISGTAAGDPAPATGPAWVVRQGEGDEPAVLATSTAERPRPAEGWAHVMDARRCTALAVADFGRTPARDRISVTADGRLRLDRDFSVGDREPSRGTKRLAFWLHFVPMPVQVGAATSPQAILATPIVEWDRPAR